MSDKPYAEQIRTPTDKASDNAIDRKHSELKKPYLSDTYEEMEHLADAPLGYSFNPSGPFNIDTPWMGNPVPDFGGPNNPYDPWTIPFYCGTQPCWCEDETKEFTMKCTQEIVRVYFNPAVDGLSVSANKTSVTVTAEEGFSGHGRLTVEMKANIPEGGGLWQGKYSVVYGEHSGIWVGECRPDSECCSDIITAWDVGNSSETIAREGNGAAAVTGSGSDIDWTISGTGFWLDGEYSLTELLGQGTSILVYADDTACGSATITAAACNGGQTATGWIRCTTGTWDSVEICFDDGGVGGSNYYCYPEEKRDTAYRSMSGGCQVGGPHTCCADGMQSLPDSCANVANWTAGMVVCGYYSYPDVTCADWGETGPVIVLDKWTWVCE